MRYRIFNTSTPTWHQLNHYLQAGSTDQPALVVQQGQAQHPETLLIRLLVSGYRTRQSRVRERRHKVFTLPLHWPDHAGSRQLEAGQTFAQAVRNILRGQVFYASKQLGASLQNAVEQQFDHGSRSLVDALFTEMTRRERQRAMLEFNDAVIRLAYTLFEQAVAPYHHTVRAHADEDLHALRRLLIHAELRLDWGTFAPVLLFWGEAAKRRILQGYFTHPPRRAAA